MAAKCNNCISAETKRYKLELGYFNLCDECKERLERCGVYEVKE